jgi:hypothetical protein
MPNGQQLLVDIGEGLSIMLGLPTIASWKTRDRPKKAKTGTFGFNIQANKLEYWNGSYWLEAMMDKA